jgi:anti-sigma factor RsiW
MIDPLSCEEVLDQVEPIAAGELDVDARVSAHVETCPRCAAALAAARRIEAALSVRQYPAPPPRFTAAVIARVRRERWRTEQRVDRLFNVAVAAALLLMIGGATALFNVDGVLAGAAVVARVVSTAAGRSLDADVPSLPTYVGSIGLFVSALGMWWWAERRLSL